MILRKDTQILNYKYEFDNTTKLIYKYYYGVITIHDITNSWEDAIKNNLFPDENNGFILDYRQAAFNISIDEYEEIPNFYRKHPEIFNNKKIAIITESSQDIVIPVLVRLQDKGYESRPFSTVNAAIKWIIPQIKLQSR